MANNVLIHAPPRTGKSTLVKKIVNETNHFGIGFHTEEILRRGFRTGFKVITSDDLSMVLASVTKLWPRVGKYGVNVKEFEELLPTVSSFEESSYHPFLYMDEIGRMQLKAPFFKHFVNLYLDAKNPFIGTIPDPKKYDCDFLKKIRGRKDVYVMELNRDNDTEIYSYLRAFLRGPS